MFLSAEMPMSNDMSVALSIPNTYILICKYNFPFKGSRTSLGEVLDSKAEPESKNSSSINWVLETKTKQKQNKRGACQKSLRRPPLVKFKILV